MRPHNVIQQQRRARMSALVSNTALNTQHPADSTAGTARSAVGTPLLTSLAPPCTTRNHALKAAGTADYLRSTADPMHTTPRSAAHGAAPVTSKVSSEAHGGTMNL